MALWKTLDGVNVLALPGLDVVCVEWSPSEAEGCAALFFADRFEGHTAFLKEFWYIPKVNWKLFWKILCHSKQREL